MSLWLIYLRILLSIMWVNFCFESSSFDIWQIFVLINFVITWINFVKYVDHSLDKPFDPLTSTIYKQWTLLIHHSREFQRLRNGTNLSHHSNLFKMCTLTWFVLVFCKNLCRARCQVSSIRIITHKATLNEETFV